MQSQPGAAGRATDRAQQRRDRGSAIDRVSTSERPRAHEPTSTITLRRHTRSMRHVEFVALSLALICLPKCIDGFSLVGQRRRPLLRPRQDAKLLHRQARTQYTIDDEVCAPTDPAELRKVVQRHCRTLDTFLQNRPIARHTAAAFEATKELLESSGPPASSRKFILDSGCGTARSSMLLGKQYPDHTILGVDRSFVRLNRNADNEADDSDTSKRPFQAVSDNVVLIRAELTDFWRCCLNEKWNIEQHYILYPNPYPKKNRLKKRFYAHPSFPLILALGGDNVVVRSNWKGYLSEFAESVIYANEYYEEVDFVEATSNVAKPYTQAAMKGPHERIDKSLAYTLFEKKYDDVGENTYELILDRH